LVSINLRIVCGDLRVSGNSPEGAGFEPCYALDLGFGQEFQIWREKQPRILLQIRVSDPNLGSTTKKNGTATTHHPPNLKSAENKSSVDNEKEKERHYHR
jgi:hypothetical protein